MKVRTGVMTAAALGAAAFAAPADAVERCVGVAGPHVLTVKVSGVRVARGEVAVTLYPDEPKRFLAPKGKLYRSRVKVEGPIASACFYLPEPGMYAVAVYHDANADRDFNRDLFGMPAEGFGFSNDPPTKLGVPSFQAVRFRARPGQMTLSVSMRYAR